MKRFLLFLVILIAVVSLGLTIYYFSVDNEMIYIKSSYLIMNKGSWVSAEGENGLLEFRNRSEYTTLTYTSQDNEVLRYDEGGKYFSAVKGGETQIIVNTNNRSFSRLVIDVIVCDGSEDYPFIIENQQDLETMDAEQNYKLKNDIELVGNWTPKAFNGVLDGNHCTISNLTITDADSNYANVGLISTLGGTIKNLQLKNVNINVKNADNIGCFAGKVNGGTIQTSEASGTITNTKTSGASYVGGVAGYLIEETKIDRCGFEGTLNITGNSIIAGGIAGSNKGIIQESYSRGKINNATDNEARTYFGGIVGTNNGSSANIYDCYFFATEEPTNRSETAFAGIAHSNDDAIITGCYYGGKMKGDSINNTHSGNLNSASNGYKTTAGESSFVDESKFINSKSVSTGEIRKWNFDGVWTMGNAYPILNVKSAAGSSYDIVDITDEGTIQDRITLYNAVKANDKDCIIQSNINMNGETWKVIDTFDNAAYPTEFNWTLGSKNGAVISNFIIDATDVADNGYVGLVGIMGSNAKIANLTFDDVTIKTTSQNAYKYVGLIAGLSKGAKVSNVKIKNVRVLVEGNYIPTDSSYFGTFFGFAQKGTELNKVVVDNIDASGVYYTCAGGFIGAGYASITSSGNTGSSRMYSYAHDVKLTAGYAGGAVGANGGNISYTTTDAITYDNENIEGSTSQSKKIYTNGLKQVYVGGVVGTNEYRVTDSRTKGTISNVYSQNFKVKATSTAGLKIYFGGIAGFNSNEISRAYVKDLYIYIGGSHNAFAGGITGYNSGRISNSVVDNGSKIITNVVPSVGTSHNGDNYILNTDGCSIVGGIAGYDTSTTNSYSINECVSLIKELRGYYVGGISGISFGKAQYSYYGDVKKDEGGVTITGYMCGGLSSVVAGGFMKNCYAICRLNGTSSTGKYKNLMNVICMDVSAAGGLTVLALNNGTLIEGCYSVATFGGSLGVSYGSSADMTGLVCGTIKNCTYQTVGLENTRNGKKLTQAEMKGTNSFGSFRSAMGDISKWNLNIGDYPTIRGVDTNKPSSSVPVFQ